MWLDVTLRYLQLLQVTIGYQRYQVLGMCACNMWLDVTLRYLQLLQVTIGYQRYQVLGMWACNMRLDVTLGYLQLLQVTIDYQRYQVWECVHVTCGWMLLWVTCSYSRLPLVTSVTRFWKCVHVICMWLDVTLCHLQ